MTDALPPQTPPVSSGLRTALRVVEVTSEDAGTRLDRLLTRELPGIPRTRLFRLIRKGEVRVNGKRADAAQRLETGDKVRVPPVREEVAPEVGEDGVATPRVRPVSARLQSDVRQAIVYQDDRLIVLDKPSGLAVHGGSGVSHGAIEALRAAFPDEELELVHRLDRDTSGVLLVARKRSTLRTLHALLREHAFEKRYLALVSGPWNLGRKRIDAKLLTHTRVGGERTVRVADNGKEALSEFRPIQFFGSRATLMEVSIFTGRTHQIRVHAAHANHPVAGDEKYGDKLANEGFRALGLERMFLHASSVSFVWPEKGTEFSVNTPLPPELARVLDELAAKKGPSRAEAARGRGGAKASGSPRSGARSRRR